MAGAKKACMVCGKERNGAAVREDYVIDVMRWFKENVTKNAKGYKIVVCKGCMPEYNKQRAKFTRRRAIYVGLGIVFTITIAVFSGGKYPGAILYGVAITAFLYLLSLISYVPNLERSRAEEAANSRRQLK